MHEEGSMIFIVARDPGPDAAYWPGRRALALLDAILWPLLPVAAMATTPLRTGLVLPIVGAVALINVARGVRGPVSMGPSVRS